VLSIAFAITEIKEVAKQDITLITITFALRPRCEILITIEVSICNKVYNCLWATDSMYQNPKFHTEIYVDIFQKILSNEKDFIYKYQNPDPITNIKTP